VFVNLLRSPGFDSQPCGPVQQPYLTCRPARLHRLAESIPRNRFLGYLNVYNVSMNSKTRVYILSNLSLLSQLIQRNRQPLVKKVSARNRLHRGAYATYATSLQRICLRQCVQTSEKGRVAVWESTGSIFRYSCWGGVEGATYL
jgi:hypothetical protein